MKKYTLTGMALCLGLVALAQEAVDFRFNLEIGQPMHINMQMKTEIEGTQEVSMDMAMAMEMIPTKKEDGHFTMAYTTKTIKMDMMSGMMEMSYDSTEEPGNEAAKVVGEQLQKILNRQIVLVMTEKGEMVNAELPEGFAEQGFDKTTFSNIASPLPGKPVVPGESWTTLTKMSDNPMVAQTDLVSTYREESAEGHVVDIVGTVSDASGNKVGTLSGYYVLNKKTHFTKSSAIKTSIEVEGMKVTNSLMMTVE